MQEQKTPQGLIVVSGGQTGVDRAALDAALALGLPVDGWCPRGRKAEDCPLPGRYPLRETPSAAYAQRTAWNVRDSDGTLVLTFDKPAGGTARTLTEAERQRKPLLQVILLNHDTEQIARWLVAEQIRRLNVAGPRESEAPGVYRATYTFLVGLFQQCALFS